MHCYHLLPNNRPQGGSIQCSIRPRYDFPGSRARSVGRARPKLGPPQARMARMARLKGLTIHAIHAMCAGNGCKLAERMWPPELFATSCTNEKTKLGSKVVAAGVIAQRHAENQCWTCAHLGSKWFLCNEKVVLYVGHFVAAWYSFFFVIFVLQFGYWTLPPRRKNQLRSIKQNWWS